MKYAAALALFSATAYSAIHCNSLGDYKCYSPNGFCLNHLVRPCENGTICDEDWRKHNPTESPCVDDTTSYACNATTHRCEPGIGIQTYSHCKTGCKPKPPAAEYKCDHTKYQCVVATTGGESKASCEKACVAPKKYVCDHTTYKCVEHSTGSSESSCEHVCKKPVPTHPPTPHPTPKPHDCKTVKNWNCENTKGFCLNNAYYPCMTGTLCSETFHKHHPSESPCINPDQSYGCNKETKQCVERSGYLTKTDCDATCH